MLHPAANRHPKATHEWLLMGVQACPLPALKRSKPSKPSKPLKTLKPLKRWLGMLHPAANSHPEATHQWLLLGRFNNPLACFILQPTGTPRPHINGFVWASKPAVCQPLNPPNPPNPPNPSYGPLKQSFGMLHPAANRHPKATHQWPLMGVQACRLPALKRSKPFKTSKLKTLKTLTWHASSCSQQPPRGHTSMASYGPLKQSLGMLHPAANRHPKATHQSLLMGVQASRLPALKPSKPSKPSRRGVGGTRALAHSIFTVKWD